jgi:nitronate monooxygenase
MCNALLDRLDMDLPIIQAPMAGADSPGLAAAVSGSGGLGSIGAAMHTPASLMQVAEEIRTATNRGFNLNFFCHQTPPPDPERAARWLNRLAPLFAELGIEPPTELTGGRAPFDAPACVVLETIRPSVVSFHFGLPEPALMERVKATGCAILATATTPDEARWLEARGVDAVIAQGAEAGGHRGVFAKDWRAPGGMIGTMALVPQIVDAVRIPVIAAGGIADGRGVAAALALGASAVQIGTAYLQTPEAGISALHRDALAAASPNDTAMTNAVTGRPARGVVTRMMRELGPMAEDAPDFPLPASASAMLRKAAEAKGSLDFTPLWAGQGVSLARRMPAADLTRTLWADAEAILAKLGKA